MKEINIKMTSVEVKAEVRELRCKYTREMNMISNPPIKNMKVSKKLSSTDSSKNIVEKLNKKTFLLQNLPITIPPIRFRILRI
jgi:hypothetical protein